MEYFDAVPPYAAMRDSLKVMRRVRCADGREYELLHTGGFLHMYDFPRGRLYWVR